MNYYINAYMDEAEKSFATYLKTGALCNGMEAYGLVSRALGLCEYGESVGKIFPSKKEHMDWSWDELVSIQTYLYLTLNFGK